jgi:DNA gyrase subunit B
VQSQEIRTLITALGTGIGEEDFDISKIRYHKVVIMTDADVDGSHIRTLLLTFFFRWMVDIINRGYLYFAQPPLFKIKKGKEQIYVKDESSLDDIILKNGLDSINIKLADGTVLEGTILINLIKSVLRMEKILDLYERKNMERRILKAFINEGLSTDSLESAVSAELIVNNVLKRIEQKNPDLMPVVMNIEKDEEESKYYVDVTSRKNGLFKKTKIDFDLTESPSFEEIVSINKKVRAVGEPPFVVEKDSDVVEIPSFAGLVEFVMENGRKNLSVQRYKGLGEMNADQLWDTTMNPENRKMLQVTVADAVKANEIFSTLMGDQVEPRRDFIERNALNVVNLDY